MSGFRKPPLVVPGRPSSEIAAEFPCPFCSGTAYFGHLALIAAAAKSPAPDEGIGEIGVAHTKPSCEKFRSLSAAEFRDACKERMRQ